MQWFLASIATLSAAAAVASALSAQRSASAAANSYRPYLAVTGNTAHWSEGGAALRLFITNSGPAPGRIVEERISLTRGDGTAAPLSKPTNLVDAIYPKEQEPTAINVSVEPGSSLVVEMEYEDLDSRRRFGSRIAYQVPVSEGPLTIVSREAT